MASPAVHRRRHAPSPQDPMAFLSLVLLLMLGHSHVAATPNIATSTTDVTVSVGQTASLSCMVEDQGVLVVTWWFLNHHLQISYGRVIITDDPRYSILTPPDGEEWTLQISDVQHSDAGIYQCGLQPSGYNSNQTLTVRGSPPTDSNVPGPPTLLRFIITSQTSIRLSWSEPSVNPQSVQGYRVFYQEMAGPFNPSSHPITETHYDLYDLTYGDTYHFYLTAIGAHGSSSPSYTLVVHLTMPLTASQGSGVYGSGLVLDCCQRSNVAPDCVGALCGLDAQTQSSAQVLNCFTEIDTLFTCAVLQRNHSSCCESYGVPGVCLGLCAGEAPTEPEQIECLLPATWTLIEACVDQGAANLPGPPHSLSILNVYYDTADITWLVPLYHPELVTHYLVRYQQEGSDEVNLVEAPLNRYRFDSLLASTHYTVSVLSVGANGTSLPSEEVVFLTYFTENQGPGPTPTPGLTEPPQTIQQCCQEAGVHDQCNYLCSYDMDLTNPTADLYACSGYWGPFFACATGHGNHSRCCSQRGVPRICHEFCAFTTEMTETFQFQPDHIVCVAEAHNIFECLEEGQFVLPGIPENFSVLRVTAHAIVVQWSHPSSQLITQTIDRYLIRYRAKVEGVWPWTTEDAYLGTHYIVQNLEPGTRYEIQAFASNDNGTSLPTPTLIVTTDGDADTLPGAEPLNSPVDVTACCHGAGVTAECAQGCGPYGTQSIQSCAAELPEILGCVADGRDHTACCQSIHVPTVCLGFCSNSTGNITFMHAFCMPYMSDILRCMHLQHDLLPTSPTNFSVVHAAAQAVTFHWASSEQNAGVIYTLFYKKQNMQSYSFVLNVESPYTLRNLEQSRFYVVYLIAMNSLGASPPTPAVVVFTTNAGNPTVLVNQSPPNFVQLGDNVTLTCQGFRDGVTTYWLTPHNIKITEETIYLHRITLNQTGKYSCIPSDAGGVGQAGLVYVKMQYGPLVSAPTPTLRVQPNRGVTAVLSCDIQGYPPLDGIQWLKNHVVMDVSSSPRYQAWTSDREDAGIIEANLLLHNVTDQPASDYGTYTCRATNGQVTNAADIVLLPVDEDNVPLSPINATQRVINVTSCCIDHGVIPACLDACDFDIDPGALSSLPNPVLCIPHLGALAVCAADGRDHRPCCRNESVPSRCLSFCSGQAPELDTSLLECVQYIETIVDCMERGHEVIPSSPTNVQGHLDSDHYIRVQWVPPRIHPETVQHYIVIYSHANTPDTMNITVSDDELEARFPASVPNAIYSVYVLASNHHGVSSPSGVVTVLTDEIRVSNPTSLHRTTLSPTSIHLFWEPPSQSPGAVINYHVYYNAPHHASQILTNSTITEFLLHGLQPNTTYTIYVQAVTATGETDHSNLLNMVTPSGPTAVSTVTPSSHKEGIIIGVIVALIVIIVLAVFIGVFWLIKKRNKPVSSDEQPVIFENPGYRNYNTDSEPSGGVEIRFKDVSKKGTNPESSS